jgi:hypothetical protein
MPVGGCAHHASSPILHEIGQPRTQAVTPLSRFWGLQRATTSTAAGAADARATVNINKVVYMVNFILRCVNWADVSGIVQRREGMKVPHRRTS